MKKSIIESEKPICVMCWKTPIVISFDPIDGGEKALLCLTCSQKLKKLTDHCSIECTWEPIEI